VNPNDRSEGRAIKQSVQNKNEGPPSNGGERARHREEEKKERLGENVRKQPSRLDKPQSDLNVNQFNNHRYNA